VQRTKVLIHLLNGASEDPLADYSQINSELALYDEKLARKPQIVVFNKMDLPEAQARWNEIESVLKARGVEPVAISAAAHQNITRLVQRVFGLMDTLPQEIITADEEKPVYELPAEEIPFSITRQDDGSFHVSGKKIERAAAMTYWDYDEAVQRFQSILETLGISAALREAGVQVGDTVFIGDHELEWTE
jgi:GTP-binding protein